MAAAQTTMTTMPKGSLDSESVAAAVINLSLAAWLGCSEDPV